VLLKITQQLRASVGISYSNISSVSDPKCKTAMSNSIFSFATFQDVAKIANKVTNMAQDLKLDYKFSAFTPF